LAGLVCAQGCRSVAAMGIDRPLKIGGLIPHAGFSGQ
jgi:hypothetical protein